jgi:hypothetical protein
VDYQQQCQFCSSASYNHTDNETYVANLYKIPCSADNPYCESNGESS